MTLAPRAGFRDFQAFVDLVWDRTKEQRGFTEESQCRGVLWGRRQKVSFAEGIERMISGADTYGWQWTVWCRQHMADVIPAKVMDRLIASLAENSPADALRLWLVEPTLTDVEASVLRDSFMNSTRGAMTTMRAKINSGELRPARDTVGP